MRLSTIKRGSGIVFYDSLGPIRNEEVLCDFYQLLVKSLSPSERGSHQSKCDSVRYWDRFVLADLSVSVAAVKSVCGVTATSDLESGILAMSESVASKLQAAGSDVKIVKSMTDDP